MADFNSYQRELDELEQGKCRFAWDELEELMTEAFQEEEISSQEYDVLMRRLMEIDCGESGKGAKISIAHDKTMRKEN